MVGGSATPIKVWPTRKLVGLGSVLVLMTAAGTYLLLRVAWTAWHQGMTVVALVAFALAIVQGSWVVVIWEMGAELRRRWRSRHDREIATLPPDTDGAETKPKTTIHQP